MAGRAATTPFLQTFRFLARPRFETRPRGTRSLPGSPALPARGGMRQQGGCAASGSSHSAGASGSGPGSGPARRHGFLSNCLRLLATSCDCLRLLAAACDCLWLLATACGCLRLLAAACDSFRLLATSFDFLLRLRSSVRMYSRCGLPISQGSCSSLVPAHCAPFRNGQYTGRAALWRWGTFGALVPEPCVRFGGKNRQPITTQRAAPGGLNALQGSSVGCMALLNTPPKS